MFRKTLVVTAAIAVALSVAGAALSRGSATPVLTGTDGPGYTITLKKSGKLVKTLKAGKYKYYCPNHESMMFAHFTVK